MVAVDLQTTNNGRPLSVHQYWTSVVVIVLAAIVPLLIPASLWVRLAGVVFSVALATVLLLCFHFYEVRSLLLSDDVVVARGDRPITSRQEQRLDHYRALGFADEDPAVIVADGVPLDTPSVGSRSGEMLVGVGARYDVLGSRLADGRYLVTATTAVEHHPRLIVRKQSRTIEPAALLEAHKTAIRALADSGIAVTAITDEELTIVLVETNLEAIQQRMRPLWWPGLIGPFEPT